MTPIAHLDCRLLSREDSRPGQASLRDHWLAKYLIPRRSDQNRTKLTADCVANTAGCNGSRSCRVAAGWTESYCRFDTLDRSDRRELPFFLRLLQFHFFLALKLAEILQVALRAILRHARLHSEQVLEVSTTNSSTFPLLFGLRTLELGG